MSEQRDYTTPPPPERVEVPIRERPADTVDASAREPLRETPATVRYEAPAVQAVWAIDRVRWGPVLAGMVATVATLVLLNVLGLAIGLTVMDRGNPDDTNLETAAAIWSGAASLIAFFVGGWIAGRSAARSTATSNSPGLINGLMVWASVLVILLILTSVGAAQFLTDQLTTGFDAIRGLSTASSGTLDSLMQQAWGTVAALVLTLILAILGGIFGYAGQPQRGARV